MRVPNLYIPIMCTTIAAAVVAGSCHIKDLTSFSGHGMWFGDVKKQIDDTQHQVIKVVGELHDHAVKTAKVVSPLDSNSQVDHRSLRLLHSSKGHKIAIRVPRGMRLVA